MKKLTQKQKLEEVRLFVASAEKNMQQLQELLKQEDFADKLDTAVKISCIVRNDLMKAKNRQAAYNAHASSIRN